MSILFESAIAECDLSTAVLYSPTSEELAPTKGESIPIDGIIEFSNYHEKLAHDEKDDWVIIPLHEQHSAELSGEYIVFTEHSVHGKIFVYDDGGENQFIDSDTFARSGLADRIRFWHSDHTPEDPPSYFDSPIAEREPPRNPLPDDSANDFFDELESFVRAEMDAQREEHKEQTATASPEELYDDGFDAIPALSSLGQPKDGVFWFRIDDDVPQQYQRDKGSYVRDEFGIFEGTEVLLHPPNDDRSPDGFPTAATVDSIRGLTVGLAIDWSETTDPSATRIFLEKKRQGFAITRLLNPVPFQRELNAINRIRDRENQRSVLTGKRAVTFGDTAGVRSSQQDIELNQEQELAASCALLADDLFCIHGPPGTGKTRTLVEVVRRSAQAGETVLVCADSNQAVDNLVVGSSTTDAIAEQSLHAYAQHAAGEFTLRRVNATNSSSNIVRERYATTDGRADVVATTNSSAATLDREFDVLVLDEATQTTCTSSCIPLSRASKVVLAGDHKQLPPFSATEEPPDSAAGMSLFEHLYADGGVFEDIGIQLRTQYRMHRDIAYFSNRRFYDRALRQGRDVTSMEDQPAIIGYDIGGGETTIEHSKRNDAEVRLSTYIVNELLENESLEATDIGVITPYSAQVDAIRAKLTAHCENGSEVDVDTIDSYQGSEKVAIVISLVRSNGDGDIGFLGRPLDGARRLNVAMTRAKQFCALIGDWYTLRYTQAHADKNVELYNDLYSFLDNTGRLREVEPEFIPVPE